MQIIKPQVESIFNPRFLVHPWFGAQNQPMVNKVSGLWQEIDAALRAKGKNQTWLAEQVGVSDNAITKWKRSGKISRDKAILVSEVLELPLDRLLIGRANPMVEVLEALPFERSKAILNQFMYQIEHADDVLRGDQLQHYLQAMAKFIKDMEKRKSKK